MKLLCVTKKKDYRHPLQTVAGDYALFIRYLSPTPLSAFTSLKISKTIDKEDIDVIEVTDLEGAQSALSAIKIAKKKNVAVTVRVTSNSAIPKSVTTDIKNGVDGWIFETQRLYKTYPENLKNKITVENFTPTETTIPAPVIDGTVTLSWIGEISETDRLKKIIDICDSLYPHVSLRICGAGKAQLVMPAVRHSRAVLHPETITWTGDQYSLDDEISRATALVSSMPDFTDNEYRAMQWQRRVLMPEEIEGFVKTPSALDCIPEISACRNKLISFYRQIRKPISI